MAPPASRTTGTTGAGPSALRHTYAQLAAGFGIGTSTAYRYVAEAVDVLAAFAPTLTEAVRATSTKACKELDPLYPDRRLWAWAHMLGFRGHFSSKSRRYSTTLGELRQARADYRAA
jgi:hypothetical protein